MTPKQSRREKVSTGIVAGALSATVCTPPYVLGRLGIVMLGSSITMILILGIIVLTLGVTLQAGATGAVRAIKLSATLTLASQRSATPGPATYPGPP